MSRYFSPRSDIHVIARLLLFEGENIVLCRPKGATGRRFFLPGGHVENGEHAKETLRRELFEELGLDISDEPRFAGVCEGTFLFDKKKKIYQHEVNLVFELSLSGRVPLVSKEEHIEFVLVRKSELDTIDLVPISLLEGIRKWFRNKEPFFTSFHED